MAGGADKFFGRVYELTLGNQTFRASTNPNADALDIKFKVERCPEARTQKASVSILGMSMENMMKFLKLATMEQGKALKENLKVMLMAGYDKTGLACIVDGVAATASITQPPEIWLNITVLEGSYQDEDILYHFKDDNNPVNLMELCKLVCGKYGYAFNDKSNGKANGVTVSSYGTGRPMTLKEALDELSNDADWNLTADAHTKQVFAYPKSDHEPPDNDEITMDAENGLIRVGGISVNACEITAFLQPNPSGQGKFSKLRLKSEFNSHANGVWLFNGITQIGHYRGQEWYTIFKCKQPKRG